MACSCEGSLCLKQKGRDLITLPFRHGRALQRTLSDTPEWACLPAPSLKSKIARFERDSSRSYANCVFVKSYLVIVLFPNAGSLPEPARVEKTEFIGDRHLTQGQIQDRGWVIPNSSGFASATTRSRICAEVSPVRSAVISRNLTPALPREYRSGPAAGRKSDSGNSESHAANSAIRPASYRLVSGSSPPPT